MTDAPTLLVHKVQVSLWACDTWRERLFLRVYLLEQISHSNPFFVLV